MLACVKQTETRTNTQDIPDTSLESGGNFEMPSPLNLGIENCKLSSLSETASIFVSCLEAFKLVEKVYIYKNPGVNVLRFSNLDIETYSYMMP